VNNAKISDHHAIIPTGQAADRSKLSEQEWKIYDLAARRFLAAFLPPARLENTTLWVAVDADRFKTTGKAFLDAGWLVAEPWRSAEDKILPKLAKGDAVDVTGIEPEGKMTKAPAQYTEATILAAMETAGKIVEDEDLADALKERGLGTPATRAGIIETILARGYAERQKKNLVATIKGIQVIQTVTALHPDLASPELTGEWEKRLRDMEAGQLARDSFMDAIRDFVARGVEKGKAGKVLYQGSGRGKREDLGPCPICGKSVHENKMAYGCSGYPDCKFYVWKEICKAKVSEAAIKQLLSKGKTGKELSMTSPKTGKKFKARLQLEGSEVKFLFSESKGKKKRK